MTFKRWLLAQKGARNRVGDLARDVATDRTFPRAVGTKAELLSYLASESACDAAIETAEIAWALYLESEKASDAAVEEKGASLRDVARPYLESDGA